MHTLYSFAISENQAFVLCSDNQMIFLCNFFIKRISKILKLWNILFSKKEGSIWSLGRLLKLIIYLIMG